MIKRLRITVLAENTAGARGLIAEHGLAFWVEADDRKLLFDTGQGMVINHNASVLNVDLQKVNNIVLSHGHYDHTGGLASMLEYLKDAIIHAHPSTFQARFVKEDDGTCQSVGFPFLDVQDIRSHAAKMELTKEPSQVADGIWITGEIPRHNSFENTGGQFFLDQSCTVVDEVLDDQALYIETPEGIIVLLGCAHAGLVNTLEYVAELSGAKRIYAVLGGMHLVNASDERITRSLDALQAHDIQVIGPSHCTGLWATTKTLNTFPDRFVRLTTGSSLEIC